MIALVDYGAGNLTSVRKALAAVGADVMTPETPGELRNVAGIIVPGVGHFDATRAIDQAWRTAIRSALDRGVALLGICVGMQWLFEGSDEAPDLAGLGVFGGTCTMLAARGAGLGGAARMQPGGVGQVVQARRADQVEPAVIPASPAGHTRLKIPHVGWNSLDLPHPSRLMAGVAPHSQVYFTHSYVAPVVPEAAAVTTYGVTFASAVERGRIAGVQFHPEKSGNVGLQILTNWIRSL